MIRNIQNSKIIGPIGIEFEEFLKLSYQKFEFLKNQVTIHTQTEPNTLWLGLCSADDAENGIKSHHLVFIKDRSTLKTFTQYFKAENNVLDFGIICTQDIVSQCQDWLSKNKFQPFFLASFGKAVDTKQNLNEFMVFFCTATQIFYELKYKHRQSMIDGRIHGSAQIHPTALISPLAFIGEYVVIEENAVVHPNAVIMGHSHIGQGTEIFPHVTIYPDVFIGPHCRIHSQSVIGADGFGYHFYKGKHLKIWHMGGVILEEGVEIGAAVTIDAGTLKPTIVGVGSIIDNQVQVGHNCKVGRGVVLCGQTGMAGSAVVGDYSVFGGKAGIGPGYKIGKQTQVAGGALINCDWPDGSILGGHPARPLKEWMRGLAMVRKWSLKSTDTDTGKDKE